MGLLVSLILPNYINATTTTISKTDSKLKRKQHIKDVLEGGPSRADTNTSDDEIKYNTKTGPPTILGPTPGNPAITKPTVPDLPNIRPPADTNEKVDPNLSAYDTMVMTPDVNWEKKSKKIAVKK